MRTFQVPDHVAALLERIPDAVDVTAAPKGPTLPPAPDVVALALVQGMLASGGYKDDPAAAIGQAWAAVPHFYLSRQDYNDKIAPLYFPDDPPAFITVDDLPDLDDEAINPEARNQ